MKKIILPFVFLFAFLFFCIGDVLAEEDMSCNYNSRAHLNKLAYSVNYAVEYKTDEQGNESFDISIYNITEDIYVIYKAVNEKGTGIRVFPAMTNNGTYTFNVKDVSNAITYQVTVKTLKFGCTNDIRRFEIIKPMKNKFSDLDVCKSDDMQDYFYCQKWINKDFGLSEAEVRRKIDRKIESNVKTTTTKCVSCEVEEKNNKVLASFKLIKTYVICGIVVGIIIDLIVMIVLIIRIRRYSI